MSQLHEVQKVRRRTHPVALDEAKQRRGGPAALVEQGGEQRVQPSCERDDDECEGEEGTRFDKLLENAAQGGR